MGNASDASSLFASRISKEKDILMGSLYSVFCEFTKRNDLQCVNLLPTRCTFGSNLHFSTGILSLLGNCILLLVAYHKRSTLKPAEFFIINLSISDLGMTLALFPLAIPSCFSHRYMSCHNSLSLASNSFLSELPGDFNGESLTIRGNHFDTLVNQFTLLAKIQIYILTFTSWSVGAGGCLEKSPASSTPCVECCLVSAA